MIRKTYTCSQPELYAAARIGWANYSSHLTSFTSFKSLYTAAYATLRFADITAAEILPDQQARSEPFESMHVKTITTADDCLRKWQSLKRYISSAYPPDLQKPKLEAAGSLYYTAAAKSSWEQVRALMTAGNNFIVANMADLTAGGNMPAAFVTTFNTTKANFDLAYLGFVMAEEDSRTKTDAKITANNTVYDALISMFLDGQEIFNDTAIGEQFIFSSVLGLVSGSGPAGLQGVVTNSSNAPLAGVSLNIDELDEIIFSDPDGTYDFGNIASGSYQITIKLSGYKTIITKVVIPVNTTTRRDFVMEAVVI